jgi:hypothetical protein
MTIIFATLEHALIPWAMTTQITTKIAETIPLILFVFASLPVLLLYRNLTVFTF